MGCCNSARFEAVDVEVALGEEPLHKTPECGPEDFADVSLNSHSDSSCSQEDSHPVFLMNSGLAPSALTKERSFTVSGAAAALGAPLLFTGTKLNTRSVSYSAGQASLQERMASGLGSENS
jgi:hypothetical protein